MAYFYQDVTVTGKRNVRTVALTDSATINVDSDKTDIGVLTTLSQDSLFNAPTGTPEDNQLLQYRITSSVSRVISFDPIFNGASSLLLPTNTTGSNIDDYIAFRFNAATNKWNIIGSTIGNVAGPATALNAISTTQGSIIYRNASQWTGLNPGTAGHALISNGAAANLSYAQVPTIVDRSIRFTPTALEEGIIPCMQIAAISSDFVLANATGVQNCFPEGNNTLTLSSSTAYMVEGFYKIVTGNVTHHTTAMGFDGTATITNFEYEVMLWSAGANTRTNTQSTTQVSGVASKVLNAASGALHNAASEALHTNIKFKGILRINAAGTFIPQIAFSADPTGTCAMAIGSYISFTALGSNTFQSVGSWS